MTDAQKLEALIQRAIEGEFNFDHWRRRNRLAEGEKPNGDVETSLIFNHDFARALFGDTWTSENCQEVSYEEMDYKPWEYHLQQAVISDNPIDYMYQAVFGDAVVK